ncbi:MAG TPA: hypothetical protein VGH28_10680 [Polyangiaceae bacterium]|jgi:hypothetical protein
MLLLGSGCEEKTPPAAIDAAPVTSATTSASAAPEAPRPPVVTIDDAAFEVAGDKVNFGGDAKGRIVGLLASKPLVAGQTLEVDALRDTTMAHFSIAVDALREAKVKDATVKTAKRDRTVGTLHVVFEHAPAPACAPVAMVAKDNAILVWPRSGAVAQRYTHGFAGPDITLGSAELIKETNACGGSIDYVAGDDSIKWGVVFDLATAGNATSTIVVTKPPVPGRKVTED